MTKRVGTPFLFLACSLLPIAAAHAALPDAAASTSPGFIRLVGGTPSGPDVTDGLFTVIVRTSGGATIDGSRVTVSICEAGDLRISQNQQNAAYTVNCAGGTVSALTDNQGQVDFTILGASTGQFVGSSVRGTVKIFADDPVTHQNVLISDPSSVTGLICSTPDEDGNGGLTASDLSTASHDFGLPWQRSDFNGDGVVDSADEDVLAGILFAGRMTVSFPPFCTSCATPTRTGTWGALKLLYR
ncbi:MAG TPA: hypothetical protein VL332_02745 [Candidatus Saccharimonadaceae bacterium]|jgi:hypothetical protein|nr:hypothetical protein [Candidatus Saccharimonadaceae bacterium]